MSFKNLTYNLTELSNAEFNINFTNRILNVSQKMPEIVHTRTEGYVGYWIAIFFFLLYYLNLSDKTQYTDFGYSDLRALAISSGLVTVILITLFDMQMIYRFRIIAMCIGIYLFFVAWVLKVEKE
ncbi:MAG: hypothetical protein ACFFDN_01360 [Candidatus Hodarchaeota archaeon]